MMHNYPMDDVVMRVKLAWVLPGCNDIDPDSTLGVQRTQHPMWLPQLAHDHYKKCVDF
jgi:hypothetical protein